MMTRRDRYEAQPHSRRHAGRLAWLVMAGVLLVMLVLGLHAAATRAAPSTNAIRSGFAGDCLDNFRNGTADDTAIDLAACNGTNAQDWVTTATAIQRADDKKCVGTTTSGSVTLQTCSAVPGQVWLRNQQGYYNPDRGACLDASAVGMQLRLASCASVVSQGETWLPASAAQTPACSGSEGAMIACETVKQWTAWQATGSNHEALLTNYTDGTPYEEWCADFVSYVYKQAGYPFTGGSADGWDENDAGSVQYMGFTMHAAGSGYAPKAGDVAFFDYPGGHVEIVVSGGAKPTFIYGDSAQVDPTTGNGQMKANSITQDGEDGSVVYYLSPAGA